MARMLAGIPVIQKCDYLRGAARLPRPRLLVFTGPIDEFFSKLGRLTYRGQRRSAAT
jgi:UDP-galactopyranose mutase